MSYCLSNDITINEVKTVFDFRFHYVFLTYASSLDVLNYKKETISINPT